MININNLLSDDQIEILPCIFREKLRMSKNAPNQGIVTLSEAPEPSVVACHLFSERGITMVYQ